MTLHEVSGIAVGTSIYIRRSDGRVHAARVSSVDPVARFATVDWSEDEDLKSKEVSFECVYELNGHLRRASGRQQRSIVPPRASVLRDPQLLAEPKVKRREYSLCSSADLSHGRPYPRKVPALSKETNRTGFKSASVAEDLRISRDNRRSSSVMGSLSDISRGRTLRDGGKRLSEVKPATFYFQKMIDDYRRTLSFRNSLDADLLENRRIFVCIRKRPLNALEISRNEIDVITVPSKDSIVVHEPKYRVDLTKYLDNHEFKFDRVFDESCRNDVVYEVLKPLLKTALNGGNGTCFAYGQTGSGKSHTMLGGGVDGRGLYGMLAAELFRSIHSRQELAVAASFFEIYRGKVLDLLDKKRRLRVLEDGLQQVRIVGLTEREVWSAEQVMEVLREGTRARTSCKTASNANSSRSHAVFRLRLLDGKGSTLGKISLVDLAGNERCMDTISADIAVRREGAEINRSLLALKECIRAMSRKGPHLPFRGSTLTQVLKDSFTGDDSMTYMIATVSPGMKSCEQTLNTLRYAERVKEIEINSSGDVEEGMEEELNPAPKAADTTYTVTSPIFVKSPSMGITKESPLNETLEEDLLDGFRMWVNNRLIWDMRESSILSKKAAEELDRNTFSSQLLEIVKEQKEFLNNLERKITAVIKSKR